MKRIPLSYDNNNNNKLFRKNSYLAESIKRQDPVSLATTFALMHPESLLLDGSYLVPSDSSAC